MSKNIYVQKEKYFYNVVFLLQNRLENLYKYMDIVQSLNGKRMYYGPWNARLLHWLVIVLNSLNSFYSVYLLYIQE